MSDVKRYSPTFVSGDDGDRYIGMFECDQGRYCALADLEAATAAKDVRIAELESAMRNIQHMPVDEEFAERVIERIDAALAGRQPTDWEKEECPVTGAVRDVDPADFAATPSEDGREVAEVVAHCRTAEAGRLNIGMQFSEGADEPIGERWQPLMTVAQHSRIVAAKDAEIAHLKVDLHHAKMGCHEVEQLRAELRAQPARQVGEGAIKEAAGRFLGWKLPKDFSPDAGVSFTPPNNPAWWPTGTNLLSYDQAQAMFAYALEGAALAPAAVDVVLPERLGLFGPCTQQYALGYNAALDEVDRLNRRAIPVELLERIAKPVILKEHDDARADACRELRALLGKDEK